MSKRRLTRRQQWRIEKIQNERIERAQKRQNLIEQRSDEESLGPEQSGLVTAHYGTQVEVEALEQENTGTSYRCHMRTNLTQIVTGDKVVWRMASDQSGVIVAVSQRRSELSRPDARGNIRPIAANIDRIFIVIAPEPMTPPGLIDRYLVAAEDVSIRPIILVNKADLLAGDQHQQIKKITALYKHINYSVVSASTIDESGLSPLKKLLHQHTSVFVGQSGVGKSSLINILLPNANLRTSALSEATGKGVHTTTTARLFHLPEGGDIIDSPGIREFSLEHINLQQLTEGFIEFRPFIGHCKFRNCRHQIEPNCALQKAVEEGLINTQRMTSYLRIAESLTDT